MSVYGGWRPCGGREVIARWSQERLKFVAKSRLPVLSLRLVFSHVCAMIGTQNTALPICPSGQMSWPEKL